MSKRRVVVLVLCEDHQQRVFLVRLLKGFGVGYREVRVKTATPGKGAASQFVREQYPDEIRAYRSRSTKAETRLLVMVDADTLSVKQRAKELSDKLESEKIPGPTPNERIAVLVPRRNIETWIYCLLGDAVDEVTKYKHLEKPGDFHDAVDQFVDLKRKGCVMPHTYPPSLKEGCVELNRIA